MELLKVVQRRDFKRGALRLGLAATMALGLLGCDHGEDGPEPTLKIETPANGATVTGPNVLLRVSTTHFTYAGGALGKASAAQHGDDVKGGHIHVFLDKPDSLDAYTVTNLTNADTATLAITTAGAHYLIVTGADASHADVESMRDSVAFTVTLP